MEKAMLSSQKFSEQMKAICEHKRKP